MLLPSFSTSVRPPSMPCVFCPHPTFAPTSSFVIFEKCGQLHHSFSFPLLISPPVSLAVKPVPSFCMCFYEMAPAAPFRSPWCGTILLSCPPPLRFLSNQLWYRIEVSTLACNAFPPDGDCWRSARLGVSFFLSFSSFRRLILFLFLFCAR